MAQRSKSARETRASHADEDIAWAGLTRVEKEYAGMGMDSNMGWSLDAVSEAYVGTGAAR